MPGCSFQCPDTGYPVDVWTDPDGESVHCAPVEQPPTDPQPCEETIAWCDAAGEALFYADLESAESIAGVLSRMGVPDQALDDLYWTD